MSLRAGYVWREEAGGRGDAHSERIQKEKSACSIEAQKLPLVHDYVGNWFVVVVIVVVVQLSANKTYFKKDL